MQIALIFDPCREETVQTARRLQALLARNGAAVTLYPHAEANLQGDLAIVLGGDGRMMHTAKFAAPKGIPLLGINLGRIGYLTELEPNELPLLERLFQGEYTSEERMMLEVEADGFPLQIALNDVVISNDTATRIVKIGAKNRGHSIGQYFADGIIAATPTGSTAYSLSAGGSVIDPTLRCVCVTPICPISPVARPLVFSDQSELRFENLADGDYPLRLTVDGVLMGQLRPKEAVTVRPAQQKTTLIRLKQDSFCEVLYRKMQLGS